MLTSYEEYNHGQLDRIEAIIASRQLAIEYNTLKTSPFAATASFAADYDKDYDSPTNLNPNKTANKKPITNRISTYSHQNNRSDI